MSETKEHIADIIKEGKRKALIISISDYLNDLDPLDFCKDDGIKMYDILKSFGYEIPDNSRLIGEVRYDEVRHAISTFFTDRSIKPKDTLIFYFSGHGIPDGIGEHYLATSDIDPDAPWNNGFSFEDLTKMMNRSNSRRIIVILDCCYSGSARLEGKGVKGDESAARLGREAIEQTIKNKIPSGEGRCILASSLAFQESFQMKKLGHSLFTYYLLEGLKGNTESVDDEGNVTPESLSDYVFDKIMSLDPPQKQKPIKKLETAGKIILAEHPELVKKPPEAQEDVSSLIAEGRNNFENEDYNKAIELFDKAIYINPKSAVANFYKGNALEKLKRYNEGLACYERALEINPNDAVYWNYKGRVFNSLEKYDDAIACFDKAIGLSPKYDNALRNKAISIYLKKLQIENSDTEAKRFSSGSGENWNLHWIKLLYSIQEQRCTPFIGNGASSPFLPLSRDISKKLADDYGYPQDDSSQLAKVAQFLAIKEENNMLPKYELSTMLQGISPPDFSLEQLRNTPYAVLADLNLPIYITTNYDHFMEEALKSRGKLPISDFCRWNEDLAEYAKENEINSIIYKEGTDYKPTPACPLVYHLYGDIDHPRSMVLTENDYNDFVIFLNRMDEKSTLPMTIRKQIISNMFLFIGYDVEDIGFRAITQTLISSLAHGRYRGTLVLPPNEVKDKTRLYQDTYLGTKGIRVYWGSASSFCNELRYRWEKKDILSST